MSWQGQQQGDRVQRHPASAAAASDSQAQSDALLQHSVEWQQPAAQSSMEKRSFDASTSFSQEELKLILHVIEDERERIIWSPGYLGTGTL